MPASEPVPDRAMSKVLPHADKRGRATLRTIAVLSGVHVSTVSRVLAPSAGEGVRAASNETAKRIRALAGSVGYTPNPHARGLRTERSNVVGVLAPRISDMVFATIYEGIEEAAGLRGFTTFVANSRDDAEERSARIEMFLSRRVDGVILGDSRITDEPFIGRLVERDMPFLLVSRRSGQWPAVTCDDHLGGRLAATHLLELGHRVVGVIAGEPYASTGLDRTAGFLEAYAEAGCPIAPDLVVPCHFDVGGGGSAAATLLSRFPQPTALFAVNDFAAIGAIGSMRELGLSPGIDIALVGFNDVPLAAALPVSLTSIRSPMREMGNIAAAQILMGVAGRRMESIKLEPILVVRESSCRAAV
jgi:LacI family transcriptional regulator